MKRFIALACAAGLAVATASSAAAQARPDAVRIELAQELVELSGGRQFAETMMRQQFQAYKGLFKDMPSQQQRLMGSLYRSMEGEMLKALPALIDTNVQAYARHLTERELREMIAWQSSEIGQSVTRKMGPIMRDITEGQIPLLRAMLPSLMREAVDKACEAEKCSDEDRRQITAALQAARPS